LIVLTARIDAHVSERRELVQALLEWVTTARRDAGALRAHVYEDLEAASQFCAVSEWAGAEEMESHVRGAAFGILMGALEVLGPPAVFSIARQDNGNAVETVRGIRRSRGGHLPATAR
jgi:quinol monooxygenase YgiN